MPAPRKIFRIEQMSADGAAEPATDWPAPGEPAPMAAPAHAQAARPIAMRAATMTIDDDATRRHDELVAEIKALRVLVQPKDDAQRMLESYQVQIAEMQKLKSELVIIHNAITRTKQEIATLHVTGFHGQSMSRMTHELDAVVNGTEQATQSILAMVEDIDQLASTMIEQGKDDTDKQIGREIQDRVVKVFEACNFQDITGQRISKVVNTWKFIEGHVAQMMEIWGGIDAFKDFIPDAPPEPEGDDALLNGPKLEEDAGHASQDDIDALFP
jgi:chemotaxis protein CheZ